MESSPLNWRGSSPAYGSLPPRSNFTYRQLNLLASCSTTCPLRVVAHIDLDAFYAQCEMIRLGVEEDVPLAVQQWQGLIAINYPARKFGISRLCTVTDAKKLCPQLVAQHVATWKEGDEKWAYHDDAAAHIQTHKVSLDPYRTQSRQILALIKECLPVDRQKVEKASIDEVFIDLSAQIHGILLERFPELSRPPPYDDPTEKLPRPSLTALDWKADALVDLDDRESELEDPDWDDVALLVGSEIVRSIRAEIRQKLGYTCSAGVASNKMLSKLGSGYKKPNQQTVIRNRAVQHFLQEMKFTKIRNLGGKLGEQIVSLFKTESIKDLLKIPIEQFKAKLGDEHGTWLHNTLRGIDYSEVNSRTQIKSMLSAKSFRPSINNVHQASKWLRIFVADIFSRLVEEGVLENKRRPKILNLHHRHEWQTKSRSCGIPQGKTLDEDALFGLTQNLLNQIIQEGKVWPCSNLSLSVGGFENGVTGNMGIDSFLIKGDDIKLSRAPSGDSGVGSAPRREEKRRRLDNSGIQSFFPKQETSRNEPDDVTPDEGKIDSTYPGTDAKTTEIEHNADEANVNEVNRSGEDQTPITDFSCSRCNACVGSAEELQSHLDWHLAKDLQEEERGTTVASRSTSTGSRGQKRIGNPSSLDKAPRRGKKLEQGQSQLKFR